MLKIGFEPDILCNKAHFPFEVHEDDNLFVSDRGNLIKIYSRII